MCFINNDDKNLSKAVKGCVILKKDINANACYRYASYKGNNSEKSIITVILKE